MLLCHHTSSPDKITVIAGLMRRKLLSGMKHQTLTFGDEPQRSMLLELCILLERTWGRKGVGVWWEVRPKKKDSFGTTWTASYDGTPLCAHLLLSSFHAILPNQPKLILLLGLDTVVPLPAQETLLQQTLQTALPHPTIGYLESVPLHKKNKPKLRITITSEKEFKQKPELQHRASVK